MVKKLLWAVEDMVSGKTDLMRASCEAVALREFARSLNVRVEVYKDDCAGWLAIGKNNKFEEFFASVVDVEEVENDIGYCPRPFYFIGE